eukprot:CAMPEP_0117443264 /NCGR_PEP_ID=MMETSP0759-20121206/4602_1 /TAXON_ID=63605 /ORGANISM="Percolomonas cosmopolitus, Strain WS" /LENGTH=377 /DNA_ID=CAMNT_0005235227 /DNA_START=302 /DNA_END=1435 /DNA_ORIENTATION=+
MHPVNLLATVLKDVAREHKDQVEDVIGGCVTPIGDQGANIPRLALLKAGFPETVPGVQINRMCGSGQQAVQFASQGIESGDMDMAIGCGVEIMSRVKIGADANPEIFKNMDPNVKMEYSFGEFPFPLIHQGVSAELLAEKYGVTKEECDEFAASSHEKADRAFNAGIHEKYITPVRVSKKDENGADIPNSEYDFVRDEGIRVPVNREKLGTLKTVFRKDGKGVVTAGNASQISDGAAAVLLGSRQKAQQLGLKPQFRILARTVVGSDPVHMLDGVIPATQKALNKAGLKVDDIDAFEINEAFASVVLSWQKVLNVPMDKINIAGGAIATGHPLGATGAKLLGRLMAVMEHNDLNTGLVTLCIGHGQAVAMVVARDEL